jgi:spore coat protein U-like protein
MTRRLLCLILALAATPLAHAACTTSPGIGNFGSLSSFTLASTPQVSTGTTGFKCTGSLLSLLSTNTINATISSTTHQLGTQARLYNSTTGTYLPYSICKDSGCTTPYNVGSVIPWSSTTFLGILGLFNATDGSLPLYLRINSGNTVPAGSYADTINLNWAWHLCAAGALGLCVYDDGTGSSAVTVNLTVLNDCFIDSAPDLSFGSAALVSAFTPVSANIGVRCTANATYTVTFDNGNNYSGGWRRMLNGSNAIQYNLYRPDNSAVWTTSNGMSFIGNGATQNVPYRGQINAAQGNVPAGTYTDTVRVIVTY